MYVRRTAMRPNNFIDATFTKMYSWNKENTGFQPLDLYGQGSLKFEHPNAWYCINEEQLKNLHALLKLSVLCENDKHIIHTDYTEDKICYTAAHVDPVLALRPPPPPGMGLAADDINDSGWTIDV